MIYKEKPGLGINYKSSRVWEQVGQCGLKNNWLVSGRSIGNTSVW